MSERSRELENSDANRSGLIVSFRTSPLPSGFSAFFDIFLHLRRAQVSRLTELNGLIIKGMKIFCGTKLDAFNFMISEPLKLSKIVSGLLNLLSLLNKKNHKTFSL